MMEIFQGSDIDEVLEQMFVYIKTGIEDPLLPKFGFSLHSIMQLDINLYELQLTRWNSFIELPAWITNKKTVINPKNEKD